MTQLPMLQCESRRRHLLERGVAKWAFAIVIVAAGLGDGLLLWPRGQDEKPNQGRVERRDHRPAEIEVRDLMLRQRGVLVCTAGRCVMQEDTQGMTVRVGR